ncbi:uncharacterized protein LACBIDRAFT_329304 [Laccaria bicolor S238N-H82]|uniref:Predicted protein n=1 Tax=Laccaria bicolor (strain S238N-H82 / ATCC MYA-4686) TaxID=486041 RepID=B0DHL7_LACBS|nr:uncharacterized protein LACBIDRAFT_329304 [Laccaria bicolor S238N-H82]EDR05857.1 predicted protein [Laccaria bicolor S238N-H82]|eukprot:XP_001883533.1 predicted protein [Laccaria bicolor S238N-H82]
MDKPTSSTRPSLQDATRNLNLPPPPSSKLGRSSKKLTSRATTKAVYHHIEVAEKQAGVFPSPARKRAARKSFLKASLKTTSDFGANGILDSQIDSQQWYDNLTHDGVSQDSPPVPAIEIEDEESTQAEETNDTCTNCAHLLAELERSYAAHRRTCNDGVKLARDYDRLMVEAKFLRESMVFAAAKITQMAKGMNGTLGELLDPHSE